MKKTYLLVAMILGLCSDRALSQKQMVDPGFDARVDRPAFPDAGPTVSIDEAHQNFHTADGEYQPFANLLRADGFRVVRGRSTFSADSLKGVRVLVVANAGSPHGADTNRPAFTEQEADAVRAWVRKGGALLLVADHAPFGIAAEPLARRFGITMGRGWVFEKAASVDGITTQLTFSEGNRRLGDHPIIRGRNAAEAVHLVKSFTGQSLVGPPGSVALLRLDREAREAPDRPTLDRASSAVLAAKGGAVSWDSSVRPVGDRAQGIAFRYGRGRVVVLGEGAMLSAQVSSFAPRSTARTRMSA